ncbi:fumarylacetoacetate hydrolase domain-containing protein 2 isoform X2 [Neocloeon triangulifer]|nr:fumarylacetoacetate hydrolase domain-containing protein 2 isoform X2 [Neocloeon triangulifer]XP_059489530.1 fumarylacetoacetate hydrolase domain-containing protein 2 isoform X2 [Neocloeon triangulifer]XP_059489531.1 fumarylacetoacetate hydrolase domain-containing protein 2 isoform X2 [Neocloeon triangulifer]
MLSLHTCSALTKINSAGACTVRRNLSRLSAAGRKLLKSSNNKLALSADKVCSSASFHSSAASNMRFVQFQSVNGGPQRLGVQLSQDGDIIDVSGVNSSIPNSLVKFLQAGPAHHEKAKRIVAQGQSVVSLSEVKLLPPITRPDKVVCVGLNYRDHCEEQNKPVPTEPVFFSKFSSVIVGPNDDVKYPKDITKCLDWEVELAVVIGTKGKNIRQGNSMDHVFGFTVAQDITARDWQKGHNGGQWLLGKSMDTFCPMGPCVITKEAIPDPHDLVLRSWVNGEQKQQGNSSNLVFKIDFLVSYLSNFVTLLPGDVILTGTPSGVGVFRKPPQYLKPGDVVESEIEGIGRLRNTIV